MLDIGRLYKAWFNKTLICEIIDNKLLSEKNYVTMNGEITYWMDYRTFFSIFIPLSETDTGILCNKYLN